MYRTNSSPQGAVVCAPPGRSPESFDGLGMETPDQDLMALRELVRRVKRHPRCMNPDTTEEHVLVEVGSWVGRTALVLAEALLHEGIALGSKVFCVDTFRGTPDDPCGLLADQYGPLSVFQTFCRNAGDQLHRTIFPCLGPSALWASVWRQPADLIFIDADHHYDAVLADIAAWAPHVRPGGLICGHDYGLPQFPGVKQAADELGIDGVLGGTVWWKRL